MYFPFLFFRMSGSPRPRHQFIIKSHSIIFVPESLKLLENVKILARPIVYELWCDVHYSCMNFVPRNVCLGYFTLLKRCFLQLLLKIFFNLFCSLLSNQESLTNIIVQTAKSQQSEIRSAKLTLSLNKYFVKSYYHLICGRILNKVDSANVLACTRNVSHGNKVVFSP